MQLRAHHAPTARPRSDVADTVRVRSGVGLAVAHTSPPRPDLPSPCSSRWNGLVPAAAVRYHLWSRARASPLISARSRRPAGVSAEEYTNDSSYPAHECGDDAPTSDRSARRPFLPSG